MIAPIVALYVVLFLWPLFTVGLRSVNAEGQASASDLTLAHYGDLFTDTFLLRVQWRTVVLALTSTAVTALLASRLPTSSPACAAAWRR